MRLSKDEDFACHREAISFVVVVQSSLYDNYRRRVVAPLVRKNLLETISDPEFNPTFTIKTRISS